MMWKFFVVFVPYALLVGHFAHGAPRKKIVRVGGGNDTDISLHPYMASVHIARKLCGGTIISQYYVLTAAHCIYGTSSETYVRVGSGFHSTGGKVYKDVIRIVSRDYNLTTHDYDIGLVMVPEGIALGPHVQPITLASVNEALPRQGLVVGWGEIKDGVRGQQQKLRMASVPIHKRRVCTRRYGTAFTERMICAEGHGPSSCRGDSGGPLIANGKQYGIVSWGARCNKKGDYGAYAHIPHLRTWIRKATGLGRVYPEIHKERMLRRWGQKEEEK